MRLNGEPHLDATTIVLYAQLLQSTFFDDDLDACTASVDRVLEELLQR